MTVLCLFMHEKVTEEISRRYFQTDTGITELNILPVSCFTSRLHLPQWRLLKKEHYTSLSHWHDGRLQHLPGCECGLREVVSGINVWKAVVDWNTSMVSLQTVFELIYRSTWRKYIGWWCTQWWLLLSQRAETGLLGVWLSSLVSHSPQKTKPGGRRSQVGKLAKHCRNHKRGRSKLDPPSLKM